MSVLKHSKRQFICSVPRLLLFAALLPFLIGCKETNSPGEQQTVPKVTTAAVIQQETTDYDEYTGRTEASETVDIHARVFGYLKSIEFKDGDFVKEGQTLFTIEPDEYQAIYNQSLSKITVWESKLEVAKADLCGARRRWLPAEARSARKNTSSMLRPFGKQTLI